MKFKPGDYLRPDPKTSNSPNFILKTDFTNKSHFTFYREINSDFPTDWFSENSLRTLYNFTLLTDIFREKP